MMYTRPKRSAEERALRRDTTPAGLNVLADWLTDASREQEALTTRAAAAIAELLLLDGRWTIRHGEVCTRVDAYRTQVSLFTVYKNLVVFHVVFRNPGNVEKAIRKARHMVDTSGSNLPEDMHHAAIADLATRTPVRKKREKYRG